MFSKIKHILQEVNTYVALVSHTHSVASIPNNHRYALVWSPFWFFSEQLLSLRLSTCYVFRTKDFRYTQTEQQTHAQI